MIGACDSASSIDSTTYRVDVAEKSCTRCSVRQHEFLPCQHILAVEFCDVRTRGEFRTPALHPAYRVSTLGALYDAVLLQAPHRTEVTSSDAIPAPPVLREARSRKRLAVDRKSRSKRILNRGDTGRSYVPGAATAHVAVSEDFEEHFDDVSATLPKKRAAYKCSSCGNLDHNAQRCTGSESSSADQPQVPGDYVVFFQCCCVILDSAAGTSRHMLCPSVTGNLASSVSMFWSSSWRAG